MDVTTTSKLITACYGILAVVVCLVGYSFYQTQVDRFRPPHVDLTTGTTQARLAPQPGTEAVSRRLQFELANQQQRIDELKSLLDKRESVLRLQASQLKDNSELTERLQQEADDYLDMLFEVIQSSAFHANNLARLSARDAESSAGTAELNETTDTLRVALEASQWELEQSLAAADQNATAASVAQSRLTGLQQAVLQLGEVAVPTLIGLLGDQDAEVRAWAATALGQLGAAATSSVDALNVASEDQDANVRTAAATAIQEISDSW